jgi:mRNA interferase MazF
MNQYEIVLVDLDPTIGSEIKKTRPCVILSPNEMNECLQTIVIAPITGSSKSYPTRIKICHKTTKGWIILDQIRTVDRSRILKSFGNLTEKEIVQTKNILKETYID